MLEYDPFSPEAMRDPYPAYRALRDSAPVYRLEAYDAWAVSRFADVWRVIGDARAFSIHGGPIFVREALQAPVGPGPIGGADRRLSFSMWDAPLHTAIRRVLSPPLRPAAVQALEGEVRRLARAALDRLRPTGRFDVVADYAAPISAQITLRALGLPTDDAQELRAAVNRFSRRDPGRPGMTPEGMAAHDRLQQTVLGYVQQGRFGGGVAASLRGADLAGRPVADAETATQLVTLLTGGVETLPKILAGGLLELSRSPDQRRSLVGEPQRCAIAFEEMVRHQGVLQHVGRTLVRDADVAGVRLRRGQRVFLLLQSANRDEREFPDPERFDAARRPPRHLGFGHGAHHCVGIHLARLEGRVLLEELLASIPEHSVDERDTERAVSDFQIGYTRLPIVFAA
jgi:cytochrome P450